MSIGGFAFWGLLGAFVYAAPRLLVTLSEIQTAGRRWLPWAEFVLALTFGPIGAAAFTPIGSDMVGWKGAANLRALALMIGMVANPIAPAVVHLVTDQILRRLSAPLKPVHPRKRT